MSDPEDVTEKQYALRESPHTCGVTTTTLTFVPPGTVFPAAIPWAMTVFWGSVDDLSRMTGRRKTFRSFRLAARTDKPVMCGTGDRTTATTSIRVPGWTSLWGLTDCLMM